MLAGCVWLSKSASTDTLGCPRLPAFNVLIVPEVLLSLGAGLLLYWRIPVQALLPYVLVFFIYFCFVLFWWAQPVHETSSASEGFPAEG